MSDHAASGAMVVTDGWQGDRGLEKLGCTHQPRSHSQRAARARGEDPGELLPAVHPVASLAKRWLLFYRVLQLAVDHDPVRYRDLIAHPQPEQTPRKPRGARGNPPTLERPPAGMMTLASLRPALLRLNG